MSEVRVELFPRLVPVDEDTFAAHEAIVQRMAELGQIDPDAGGVPQQVQDGWVARINGVEVPVVTFGVEPPERGGRALVSLLIPADGVQVGEPSAGEPSSADGVPPKGSRASWGTPSPDPRECIPGWRPDTPGGSITTPTTGVMA